MIFYKSMISVLAVLIGTFSWSDDSAIKADENLGVEFQAKNDVMDKLLSISGINHSDSGIRNHCLGANRIRSINFIDDQTAYLDVGQGRQVILTLADRCTGITARGFILKTRANRLCARFDSLEVVDTGMRCRIQSIEPHITLDTDD